MNIITIMESIYQPKVAEKFIERINKLTPDSKAQWGKMSVSQMLLHSQKPFLTATGEIKLKRSFFSYLFGGIARKQLTTPKPFGKNLPTAPSFIVKHEPEFEVEKKKLIDLILKFRAAGPAALSKDPHPFFGNMTASDWDGLMFKHLDHHLRQFGV